MFDAQTSDGELARAAGAGARDAFAVLVERHGTRLLRFLRMRAAQPGDADDLLQETFLLCWRKLARYDPTRPFPTWLFRIAANVAASRARRDRAHQDARLDDLAGGPDPCLVAGDADASQNLWDTVQRVLPPEPRTALWLFYAEDQPAAAIADVLGKSEGAVRILLFRARARLAAALAVKQCPRSLEAAR